MEPLEYFLGYVCDNQNGRNQYVEVKLKATVQTEAFKEAGDLWKKIIKGKDPQERNCHGENLVSRLLATSPKR